MLGALTAYHLIIIFSLTIIISYFFNLYAKKSGIPAVLLLIGLGVVINYGLRISGFPKPNLLPVLEVLGVVGLILIVLEAALDLQLLRSKIGLIIKSFFVALIGFCGTAYLAAFAIYSLMDVEMLNALLYSIPLSILSSAIILPSIDGLDEDKREFMVYESTFSDIIGIIGFYSVLSIINTKSGESIYGEIFGGLIISVLFSIIVSYILIYIFQNIKEHVKLFLLIAILLLLYAIGKMLHLSSLIIILVFGIILNNYKLFFKGWLVRFLNEERIGGVLDDMKVITAETAFVVRTFFFIIFGWSVFLGSLLSFKVIGVGLVILFIIYFVRATTLFLFKGKNIIPQLFLAPRGLITILLFFAIPAEFSIGSDFQGVLLFIILISCLVMTWSLIFQKNNLSQTESCDEDYLLNTDLISSPLEESAEGYQEEEE
jgi:NhaP-type Na+/H+ and K+/H+ antiporter